MSVPFFNVLCISIELTWGKKNNKISLLQADKTQNQVYASFLTQYAVFGLKDCPSLP